MSECAQYPLIEIPNFTVPKSVSSGWWHTQGVEKQGKAMRVESRELRLWLSWYHAGSLTGLYKRWPAVRAFSEYVKYYSHDLNRSIAGAALRRSLQDLTKGYGKLAPMKCTVKRPLVKRVVGGRVFRATLKILKYARTTCFVEMDIIR